MKTSTMRDELKDRYKCLYENAQFLLAPFMYEQTEKEFNDLNEKSKKLKLPVIYHPLIYLKTPNIRLLRMLEEALLGAKLLENTDLYKYINYNKNNKEYIQYYKKGLELLEKKNNDKLEILKDKLDIWNILTLIRKYISNQSISASIKENKLKAMDEYFRIARYKNDGKVWTSGYHLNFHDAKNFEKLSFTPSQNLNPVISIDKKDIGISNNKFIENLAKKKIYLTEEEKQEIYLTYHDELPWNFSVNCDMENMIVETMIDTRLKRPDLTKPCNKSFTINEEEIFVNPDSSVYRYFCMCPHCGFIVNIPKKVLSNRIQDKIEKRCLNDSYLFRKMMLTSELKKLEELSKGNSKKVVLK